MGGRASLLLLILKGKCMDAHVFRRLCDALIPVLTGARLEKIQSPAPNVFMFTLFCKAEGMAGRKRYLYLKAERKQPFLFLSTEKAAAGGQPSAPIMRLRKYVGGHRVAACVADWPGRKLALLCGTVQEAGARFGQECWLVLDMREGASLWMGYACGMGGGQAGQEGKSAEYKALETFYQGEGEGGAALVGVLDPQAPFAPQPVRWPAPEELDSACESWRAWPVLTPALRRTLPFLDPLERQALLADLEYGGGDLFCYAPLPLPQPAQAAAEDTPPVLNPAPHQSAYEASISAWPLPPALRCGRQEDAREDVCTAFTEYAAPRVLGALTRANRAYAAAPLDKEAARLSRILEKQVAEEDRLHALCAEAAKGLALQAVLWLFDAESKAAALALPQEYCTGMAEEGTAQEQAALKRLCAGEVASGAGNERAPKAKNSDAGSAPMPYLAEAHEPVPEGMVLLALNPRLTLRENMAAFFAQAKRGRRGLAFVAHRRQEILLARDAALQAAAQARMGLTPSLVPRKSHAPQAGASLARSLPKGVQGFISSDGFAIVRGRDVKGNLTALRMAGAHDIWLHVGGGPGSHAIIRRSFAGQPIPESTLDEAGALVLCKSWQRDNDRAEVIYAEARHIKPMKNAGAGMVRIDKVLATRVVAAQAGIEEKLALPSTEA
jgi:hypothetical protein